MPSRGRDATGGTRGGEGTLWRAFKCVLLPLLVAGGLAACASAPVSQGPGKVEGEVTPPKVATRAENASPAETIGDRPAGQRPGDVLPRPTAPAAADLPASPAPTAPAPDQPAETTPKKPAETAPDKPEETAPDKPTAPAPDKPTAPAPDQPAETEASKPAPAAPLPAEGTAPKAIDDLPALDDVANRPLPPPDDGLLEQTRRTVRSTTLWLARGVDSWFGDKPFDAGGRVTDGRLSLSLLKRQDESLDFKVRFNARFRLPNVEERTYFFLGRDNDRETVADTPGALSRQDRLLTETRDDRTFFAGVGYALLEAFDLRVGFHGIRPYAQARFRDTWNLTLRDLIEFRQTFFWRTSDHFGSTTAVSYEHAYSSTLAFRWLTASTRTQKSRAFDWSSIVGLYKGFANERLLALEYVVGGAQHTGVLFTEHGAQSKWSQPVYQDWLFAEGIVGLYWPRRALFEGRTHVWAFGAGLTMRF